MRLKPGDLCVIVDGPRIPQTHRHYVGMQVSLVQIELPPVTFLQLLLNPGAIYWRVTLPDGQQLFAEHSILRKIDPPKPERGSWEEIAKTTGYRPPARTPSPEVAA